MKKYLYLLMCVVCMGFVSCGGSDDDSDAGNDSNGVLENKNSFVGYWDEGGRGEKWVFFPDGSSRFIEINGYEIYRKSGTWEYDEQSKTLITTRDYHNYLINYSSSHGWSGIDMNGGYAVTYSGNDIGYVREYLNGKKWRGQNGTVSITSNTLYSGSRYKGMDDYIVWRLDGWESDSGYPECKSPSIFYENGEYVSSRTYFIVEVERSINVSDVSVDKSSVSMKATIDDDYFYTYGVYGYKTPLRSEKLFDGNIFIENMYSSTAKLIIDGRMNGKAFTREYTIQ